LSSSSTICNWFGRIATIRLSIACRSGESGGNVLIKAVMRGANRAQRGGSGSGMARIILHVANQGEAGAWPLSSVLMRV